MKNLYKFISIIIFALINLFSIFAIDAVPYAIEGEMVIGENVCEDFSAFSFTFSNQSEKDIKNFTIVFYVFDEDGEPVLTGRSCISTVIDKFVEAGDFFYGAIGLDKYFYNENEIEEPYCTDYIYVSKIVYADGSKWTDPYGLKVF